MGLPYLQTSREFGYVRDIRDTVNFANRQEYILFPSDRTRLAGLLIQTFYHHDIHPLKHDGYFGLTLLLLTAASLIYRIQKRRQFVIPYFDLFLFLAGSAYVLSLGPVLQWFGHVVKLPFPIPLPYIVFYYLIPGFSGFRNSARWELVVVLGLSIACGLFIAHVLRTVSKPKQWLCTVVLCLLVLIEIPFPIQYQVVPHTDAYPPVYSYLATLPERTVIIEMPIYNWNMPNTLHEQMRLLYSTKDHLRSVNGTSGFSPPEWQKHADDLYFHFPDTKTMRYLTSIGVTYVIVHAGEYQDLYTEHRVVQAVQPRPWRAVQKQIMHTKSLRLVKQFGNDFVYKVVYE
jgi:hypothetical protein